MEVVTNQYMSLHGNGELVACSFALLRGAHALAVEWNASFENIHLFAPHLDLEDVVVGRTGTPINWNINETTRSTRSANNMHKKCQTVNNNCRMIPI